MSHLRRGKDGKAYYKDLSEEDYHLKRDGGQEPAGLWYGRGSERLGLSGHVRSVDFCKVFDGYSPTGEPLTQSTRKDRRPGFDLTFSAPKSVSVAWSQADPEMQRQIRQAVLEATKTALSYIEEEATFTRLGKDGHTKLKTGELTAALFQHAISRALDPQLHVHALVFNYTDGRTLDGHELYRVKMAAGSLFRADLASRMERLGFGIERDGFAFKVRGVTEDITTEFSKRSEAIREQLGDRPDASARQKAKATLETREPKRDVDREKLMLAWKNVGMAYGLDAAKVRELATHHQERDHQAEIKAAVSEATRRLVGPEDNDDWQKPEHERTPKHGRELGLSNFSRHELIRLVSEEAQGRGLDAKSVLEAVNRHLETSPEIVRLGTDADDAEGHTRYTSRELHDLEKDLIAKAERMKATSSHRVSERVLAEALAARPTIKAEQKQAVKCLTGEGNIATLIGWAGTGKTYTLNTVREVFERSGCTVLGAATAGKAAEELKEEAGIQSETIAKLLYDLKNKPESFRLTSKHVLIIDEAGMVGTRALHSLITRAESVGAKVILTGDDKQLQAIDAGGGLSGLSKRFGYAELKDITRQKSAEDRAAVYDLASGERERIAQAIRSFAARGKLRSEEDREETMQSLVGDWTRDKTNLSQKLVLTSTNAQARTLNRMIQAERAAAGELGLVSVKVGEERIHLGDRVLFTKRQKAYGGRDAIENGMLGTVQAFNPINNRLTVRVDGKKADKTISVDLSEYQSLTLGYSVTTHKAQGATVDSSYVFLGSNLSDAQSGYVQSSRHRHSCKLYVSRDDAGEDLADLISDMSRDRRKTLAVDAVKEEPKPTAAPKERKQSEEPTAQPQPTPHTKPESEPTQEVQRQEPAAKHTQGVSMKL